VNIPIIIPGEFSIYVPEPAALKLSSLSAGQVTRWQLHTPLVTMRAARLAKRLGGPLI